MPPRKKILTSKQEAQVIALRLSEPPEGRNSWTLRLLADNVVELPIVLNISPQTIRRMLKKQHNETQDSIQVHPSECQ